MKVKLIFKDWMSSEGDLAGFKRGKSKFDILDDLSFSCFHPGSTFNAEIDLSPQETLDLQEGFDIGACPIFYVMPE